MSEDNQKDELNPTAPPETLVKRVWQTRQFDGLPTSSPNEEQKIAERRKNGELRSALPFPDPTSGGTDVGGNPRAPRSKQIERLLGCAYRASIFLNPEGIPFARMPGDAIHQSDVASLHSREFAIFLREQYYAQFRQFPEEALLRVVRDLLDRDASRRHRTVALRVAGGKVEHAGEPQVFRQVLALDLGRRSPADADSVLEIDANGWAINHSSGFAFVRPRGHRPLPLPEPAGAEALTELKDLLRVDEPDWLRIQIWLLAAMRPKGPYPILVLQGEARSGKSQAAIMLKSLLDPAAVPFHPLPTNPNMVLRQANRSWIQAFDHVTGMPKQISTALCRLSTSAAFSLQVHGSPITISLARPILITVPTSAAGAPWKPTGDLQDRILTVTLPPLTAETTRPESEITERFLQARPKILGTLAQAVSAAMRRVDQIRLASYPRHAEAAVWAVAAAPALNTNHELLQQALAEKSQFQIPQDPLQQKIAILMATRADWQGSATELKLTLDLSDAPNQLSRKLKQVQEILQVQGIEISFPPRQEKGQLIRITTLNKAKEGWSSRSASRSAVDLPVGNVDCTLHTLTTVPTEIDRQIVSASENKEETITVPLQTDRQALMPADTGTAPPAESRGYVDCDGRAFDDVAQEWQQNAA